MNSPDFDLPLVATIFPLRSRYAEDVSTELVNTIGALLKEEHYIQEAMHIQDSVKAREIDMEDYRNKHPVRRHRRHWIDGGDKIGGVQPDTALPFFINPVGSKICRLCDGTNTTDGIIRTMKKDWGFLPREAVVTSVMSFLLLLEELDLLEFTR
jgi:hypothetical protein